LSDFAVGPYWRSGEVRESPSFYLVIALRGTQSRQRRFPQLPPKLRGLAAAIRCF
jgi:hypothetical protein